MMQNAPVIVLNTKTERESGRKAQLSNIEATKTVSDIVRTCLGPRAMLKMLLDPMGGVVLTNDGNALLREIDVAHPAAKSMLELCRAQDEEVGDGTTSVIILAGEVLARAAPLLERGIHPVVIIDGFRKALIDGLARLDEIALPVDTSKDEDMLPLIATCLGTKFGARWSNLLCRIALTAVRAVATVPDASGHREIDIKRYVRVEKIPGGEVEESMILDGVALNKDVTHAAMNRRLENPRVILLDCPLEYKKGESQTNIEISREGDWAKFLGIEEEQVRLMCEKIIALKPNLVITEKGVSDLAQHFFVKAGITALRRVRKSDNNRIARAVNATIVNRIEDLKESDVGTGCGLFEVKKIGDEYFSFLTKCKSPKACTIIMRGPSKDVLNELERNLQDALCVARNLLQHPSLVPGGGGAEMAISVALDNKAAALEGIIALTYKALARALEVIPRTLIQNCGGEPFKLLADLRARHADASVSSTFGIDGIRGVVQDMKSADNGHLGILDPFTVRAQAFRTAVESACMILRVDDIVSGISNKEKRTASTGTAPAEAESQD